MQLVTRHWAARMVGLHGLLGCSSSTLRQADRGYSVEQSEPSYLLCPSGGLPLPLSVRGFLPVSFSPSLAPLPPLMCAVTDPHVVPGHIHHLSRKETIFRCSTHMCQHSAVARAAVVLCHKEFRNHYGLTSAAPHAAYSPTMADPEATQPV